MADKQLAVVTGASRGIGLAIAEAFKDAGYQVIGTATGEAGVEKIISALGDGHHALQLNVTDDASIAAFMQELKARELAPGVLINNAGITRDNLLLRMKDDEWNDVINANLSSIFKMSKQFLRAMVKARWGRIVNITSVVGTSGNPGQANYAAAKAGVTGFTKSLAREVANRGITVNAVAPGMIDTDMTRALTDQQREAMISQIPAGRLGSGADVANAVLFLVSDGGAYITGETIHVNGGMLMA
ncbi:MAG: 3-oxoacyl-ACP reductase FabG [Gammaproteobacteria bacterium]